MPLKHIFLLILRALLFTLGIIKFFDGLRIERMPKLLNNSRKGRSSSVGSGTPSVESSVGRSSTLRDRRRNDLEREIREAAFRHYLSLGYDGFTLKGICDEVGISLRTIFRYFPTKDDILAYPIQHRVATLVRFIKQQPHDISVVTAYLNATLAMLEDENYDPDEVQLIQQVLRDVPSLRARYVIHLGGNAQDEMEAEFARRLDLPISDPRVHLLRSYLVMAAVTAMVSWSKDPAGANLRALSQDYISMLTGVEEAIRLPRKSKRRKASC